MDANRLALVQDKGQNRVEMTLECNCPRDCFKTFYRIGVLNEEEGKILPKVVRKRNQIVHIYDFEPAGDKNDFIVHKVVSLCESILKVVEKEWKT